MNSWIDGVIAKLTPVDVTPPLPQVHEFLNLLRKAKGEPPLSWIEYVEQRSQPLSQEGAEQLARLLDEARAKAALEEAFLVEQPRSDWI